MRTAEKLARDTNNNEKKELIKDFKTYLKNKNKRLGFFEQITICEYLLNENNKLRKLDKAIISYRKIK